MQLCHFCKCYPTLLTSKIKYRTKIEVIGHFNKKARAQMKTKEIKSFDIVALFEQLKKN